MLRPFILLALLGSGCADVPPVQEAPPSSPEAMHNFLLAGQHHGWHGESEVFKSDLGDAGARVFLNDILWKSLAAGNDVHPVGSAAVRELYKPDFETPAGFGALVKTQETGQAGAGWYFFETFQMEPGQPFSQSAQGAPGCVQCHQEGVDFVQTKLPLL